MSNKNDNNDDGVVQLADVIRKISPLPQKEQNPEEAMELGLETFQESLEDASGFITVTFDSEGQPSVIHAGELDLIKTVGTLDFIKNEMLNNAFQFNEYDNEVFDGDDETHS